MPLRGPSVQLATRRDAGMPHQCGANFSGSFICSGGVSQHGGVRQDSRLPIYSDSQSPVAARPGTLSIKADNRRLLAAADIIETADLGFRPISNGGSLAGHRFNTEEKMIRIPKEWRPKPCSCGSGKLWSPQYDARGIFLTYTCEDCHDRKMAKYRPDVLTNPSYWTDEPIDDD
jgi:hypothetical protein